MAASSLFELPFQSFQKLAVLDQEIGLPGYVKTASARELTEPRGPFADPVRRVYPCHSPAATWLSWVDYTASGQSLPEVEAGLRKAAYVFGILPDVQAAAEKVAAVRDQQVSPNPDFYAFVPDSDHSQWRGPLHTPDLIEKTASWFVENRIRMDYDTRREVAQRILRAVQQTPVAGGLDTGVMAAVEKSAGLGQGATRPAALQAIQCRRRAAERMGQKETAALLKNAEEVLAQVPAKLTERAAEELVKLASEADADLGIWSGTKPSYGIPSVPEDTIFPESPSLRKVAADRLWRSPWGDVYRTEDLERVEVALPPGEIPSTHDKRAQLEQLPKEAAQHLLQQAGVYPEPRVQEFDPGMLDRLRKEYETTYDLGLTSTPR